MRSKPIILDINQSRVNILEVKYAFNTLKSTQRLYKTNINFAFELHTMQIYPSDAPSMHIAKNRVTIR